MERLNGADGIVSVKWKTSDMSAVSGKDYEGGEGEVKFFHGEVSKMLEIPIFDDQVQTIIVIADFTKQNHSKNTIPGRSENNMLSLRHLCLPKTPKFSKR